SCIDDEGKPRKPSPPPNRPCSTEGEIIPDSSGPSPGRQGCVEKRIGVCAEWVSQDQALCLI
ncbi:hypothetical protein, partial [Rhizobacter sp. Root1221]|uniref:hypothetical protein n=1 Tax=Rhizobacter sp. Root1221 TaxID=1736433 RepID=UPI001F2FCB37